MKQNLVRHAEMIVASTSTHRTSSPRRKFNFFMAASSSCPFLIAHNGRRTDSEKTRDKLVFVVAHHGSPQDEVTQEHMWTITST